MIKRAIQRVLFFTMVIGFVSISVTSCRSKECKEKRKIRINAMITALTQSYTDVDAVREYSEKSIDAMIDKFGCECLKKPNLPIDQQKELLKEIEEDNKELIERLEKSKR